MTPGPLIVISGPSGSGKSTLVRRLLAQPPGPLRLSVSVTTRKPRKSEKDGVDYHYWDAERVKDEIARGGFLEWAEVFGNYYGTLVSEVEPFRMEGIGVLLEIDVCGWEQVKTKCADAVSIFIRTSSLDLLEDRLRRRKSETEENIQRRLAGARVELSRIGEYHHQVVNDDLDDAFRQITAIISPLFARSFDA
jgi:guanylate kinase